jgi:hypothetical protein
MKTSTLILIIDSSDVWFFDGARWNGIKDASDTLNPLDWYCGIDCLYEGQYYKTLMIGTKCWFAENLDAGTMIGGSQAPADNGQIEKYCYNNQASNCAEYGGLYSWDSMAFSGLPPSMTRPLPMGDYYISMAFSLPAILIIQKPMVFRYGV